MQEHHAAATANDQRELGLLEFTDGNRSADLDALGGILLAPQDPLFESAESANSKAKARDLWGPMFTL